MRNVLFIDILVVVAVLICIFKFDVTACRPNQDGSHSSESQHGKLTIPSILLLRAKGNYRPIDFDSFPPEMKPDFNDTFTQPKPRRHRPGHRGGVRHIHIPLSSWQIPALSDPNLPTSTLMNFVSTLNL